MPTFLSLMKDTCPFIDFQGNWKDGNAATDKLLDDYASGTYHYSQTPGDTMTVHFNGTGVGFYGAKRPGYGTYQITVDGVTYPAVSADSPTPVFNQTLFNTTFAPGLHTATITNTGSALDIDYVAVQSWIGEDTEKILVDTFQDDHPSYVYDPPEAWGPVSRPSAFSGSSGHFSDQWNASFIHHFRGGALFLYGTVTPTSSPAFTAQLDGGEVVTLSAQSNTTRPHQVFYYASGLDPGWHQVRVQVGANSSVTGSLSIDFSNIYTTTSIGSGLLEPDGEIVPASHHQFSTGAIAGLSVTSALALIALFALINLIFYQKKEKKQWSSNITKTMSQVTA